VAREAARRELWFTIRNTELLPGWSVGRYLDEFAPPGLLADTVGRAEIIGGPRWLNADVCQFHLQLDGEIASDLLVEVARRGGPFEPADVRRASRDWLARPFVATGMAISVDALTQIEPPVGAVLWRAVSKADRVAAVEAAHRKAVADANAVVDDAARHPVSRLSFFDEAGVACVEVELVLPETGAAFVGMAEVDRTPGDARPPADPR
ncbi:MAG: hypothetical protein AAF743_13610, partial [Planctomycetota bacterium]